MSTQPAVFITVPKYVAITPIQATTAGHVVTTIGSTALPKIRPAPAQSSATDVTVEKTESTAPKGKKRRLDHLSWEEKVQRKKLKNRVAAQTSRDRKKARMEDMEHEIQDLTDRTEILVNKCESLQVINDSLLEKNQKLDMEVEILRQQLQELQQQIQQQLPQQQQQKIATCAGWLKPQGLPVVTGDNHRVEVEATAKKECNSFVSMACDNSLPSLQDMLLSDIEIDEGALDDAEFDAGKLEELAESLLADITADLEASDQSSNASAAKISSGRERLLGPMVGSTTECLESSQYKTSFNGDCLEAISTNNLSNCNSIQTPELTFENKLEKEITETASNISTLNTNNTTIPDLLRATIQDVEETATTANTGNVVTTTPDTVYGTYDAKTNSITIVMDDVSVPVNEAVEEIYCDGVGATSADEVVCNSSSSSSGVASPSHVYLNVTSCTDDEAENDDDDLNFDPIAKFLCPKRPLVSPLAKSPAPSLHSAISDHGYESIIGSPTPPSHHFEILSDDLSDDDFSTWPVGFNDLFPSLL